MEIKKPIIEVYSEMLQRANKCREWEKAQGCRENNEDAAEFYGALAAELFYWVAELEKTEEINPKKCRACGENMFTSIRAHHHTDENHNDITE